MKRAVRAVIRIIASGLILFGGIEIGLEFLRPRANHTGMSVWAWVIAVVLIALGIFLILASESLAEQLTDDIEE